MNTPSKGAMLAAMEILSTDKLFPQVGWAETREQWVMRVHPVISSLIDESTGTAELLAALQRARQFIASEWGEDECEFIDILLTKHTK